jgi:SOS response regulatory protein OraA/RecX
MRRAKSPPPPKLTALRRARPGTVLLELDGEPWRFVPDEVVVRCGLSSGVELDRPLLRLLRRELRRAEALDLAGRTLRRRDLSHRRLSERLERGGVAPAAGRSALLALSEARIVDDARLANGRAATLAERGWGDAAIAARLDAEGIPEAEAGSAIAKLESEAARAARAAVAMSDRRKVWALLTRRGFAEETIEAVVESLDEETGGGLG